MICTICPNIEWQQPCLICPHQENKTMTHQELEAATFMIEQADKLIDEGNARIQAARALMRSAQLIFNAIPAITPKTEPNNLAPVPEPRKEAP